MKTLEVLSMMATLDKSDEIILNPEKDPWGFYVRSYNQPEVIFCGRIEGLRKSESGSPIRLERYLGEISDFKHSKWKSYTEVIKKI